MAHKVGEHLDESTVHAWLDGALPAAEAARVEAHVQQCDACAERVARARGLIAAASRILRALDDAPVQVMPAARRRPPVVARWRGRATWLGWPLRVAASLLLVAGGSVIVARRLREPVPASVDVPPTTVTAAPPAVAPSTALPSTALPSTVVSAAPVQPQTSPPAARLEQRAVAAAKAARSPALQSVPRSAPTSVKESASASASAPAASAREAAANTDSAPTRLMRQLSTAPACYDVVLPAPASVPRRIVLDTGHAALVNARVAHWTAPAPDSVEVVTGDQATVAGHVTPAGMTGAVSAAPNAPPQPFTAKRCPPR